MFYKYFGKYIAVNVAGSGVWYQFAGKKYLLAPADWLPLMNSIKPIEYSSSQIDQIPDGGSYSDAKTKIRTYGLFFVLIVAVVFLWKPILKLF